MTNDQLTYKSKKNMQLKDSSFELNHIAIPCCMMGG